MIDTTRLNVWPKRPIKQEKFILDIGIIGFGVYSDLFSVHSNTGAYTKPVAVGTADIVFNNNDFIFLWVPEK